MSKARMYTNLSRMPTLPGLNHSRPSGADNIGLSDNPETLALAMLYGNRQTRRLVKKKLQSNKFYLLIKSVGIKL